MKRLKPCLSWTMIIFILFTMPVHANSLPDIWEGEKGNMTVLMNKDCPIEVESELLTFDVQEFLEEEYREPEDFLAYTGKVTAEYTFYNPTDSKITARLAFPFGRYPSAAADPETWEYTDDTEKYDITVNGEKIKKNLRYTHTRLWDFEAEVEKEKLRDQYVEDTFYKADTPVTKYTYDIMKNDVSWDDLDVKANLKFDSQKTKLYADKEQTTWLNEDGSYDMSACIIPYGYSSAKKTVSIYLIGEPIKDEITWKFYDTTQEVYWDNEEEARVDGEVVFVEKETFTLEELIFSEYDEAGTISKTDWYNSYVDFLEEQEGDAGITGWTDYDGSDYFNEMLMRWYEYEIVIEPNEKIVNTVTAPIYPTIDKEYEPACYEYMYLLSPAKLWNDFGSLKVVINTPYHLVGDNKKLFEKTETGYVMEREGLPDEELEFTLSESAHPRLPFSMGIEIILLGIVVLIAVVAVRQRKKKKTSE